MNAPNGVSLIDVKKAFIDLGGEANWKDALNQLTKNRNGDYSYYLDRHTYKTAAFQVVQQHCSSYNKFTGRSFFEKVRNRPARFRLLEKSTSKTPIALDIREPEPPERVMQETYRILRDTNLARSS